MKSEHINTLISLGATLAGPHSKVALAVVKGGFQLVKFMRSIGRVPSELLAIIETAVDEGHDANWIMEEAKARYLESKANLDRVLDEP